jgi:C4-dicarboxylate-specific signal transduction histidine kinase
MIFCNERFKNKNVELKLSIPDNFKLNVRPNQITQVLLNLLNNSFDSIINANDRWVKISATEEDRIIKIEVTDSGEKIPPEIQSKMMLPFFTTKEVGKGTGLGLSISQGLIENHGGKLFFDKTAKNNCFKIELPYE